MRKLIFCALAAAVTVGCASHPEPIVDLKGVSPAQYERDREECAAYAGQVEVKDGVARGAAVGAVVGAAAGAISGDADGGAGYGAIYGGTRSGLDGAREKQMVFKRCLRGRGYRVLN
ncbi:MAG: glycine zipper family protein [Pseudomonadota bacterium]